ncbi:MAG: hypothetical protein ACI8X5_001803 [Planctomycetota bacterium]
MLGGEGFGRRFQGPGAGDNLGYERRVGSRLQGRGQEGLGSLYPVLLGQFQPFRPGLGPTYLEMMISVPPPVRSEIEVLSRPPSSVNR